MKSIIFGIALLVANSLVCFSDAKAGFISIIGNQYKLGGVTHQSLGFSPGTTDSLSLPSSFPLFPVEGSFVKGDTNKLIQRIGDPTPPADSFTTVVESGVRYQGFESIAQGSITSNFSVRNMVYAFDRNRNSGMSFTGSVEESFGSVLLSISDTSKLKGTLEFDASTRGGETFEGQAIWRIREANSPVSILEYLHIGNGDQFFNIDLALDNTKTYEIFKSVLAPGINDFTTDGISYGHSGALTGGAETYQSGYDISFRFALDPPVNMVPEPTSPAFWGIGALCIALFPRRKKLPQPLCSTSIETEDL